MKVIKIELAPQDGLTNPQQIVKLLVGTAAGWGATKLVEKGFMLAIKRRGNSNTVV